MYRMVSRGLGDVWSAGKTCPQMNVTVPAAAFVLDNATSQELLALKDVANDKDTKEAIQSRNAEALGWHLAGGDDCNVGTYAGRAFNAAFTKLRDKIESRVGEPCDVDPATGMYTCPEMDVNVPRGTVTGAGMNDYLMWGVAALAAVLFVTGKRRR